MSYNESLKPFSNYPCMTQRQWDEAPWSEPSRDPVEVGVTASYTLSKDFDIWVNNYVPREDYVDDTNEIERYNDFSDTDFMEEFDEDSGVYGVPELLDELQELCEEKLKQIEEMPEGNANEKWKKHRMKEKYTNILHSAEDWCVDDREVVQ